MSVAVPSATSFPKSKIKVLLLERISQAAIDIFVKEGYQVEAVDKLASEAQLIEKIADVHAIGVRSKTNLNANVLKAAKKLLAIGCFCIGTDQTDLDAAAMNGTAVFNVRGKGEKYQAETKVEKGRKARIVLANKQWNCAHIAYLLTILLFALSFSLFPSPPFRSSPL